MQGPPDSFNLESEPQFSMTELDTLIGGHMYNQIFLNDTVYQGASRNDGDQVYFVLHDENSESLLYDFGASVGDTIFNVFTGNIGLDEPQWDEYELLDYRVSQIDTAVYEDGIERKRIFLENYDVQWIEGIGNIQGLFWGGGAYISSYESHLVRFCRDGQIVLIQDSPPFSFVDENSCFSGFTTGISDYNDSQLSIYPNPVRDDLYISHLDGEPILSLKVFSSTGKEVFELEGIDSGHSPIDIRAIPTGIYFLQVLTNKSSSVLSIIKE